MLKKLGKFTYFDQGKGQPIVFLAGAGTTVDFYDYFLRELSKNFRVIAINYPGYLDFAKTSAKSMEVLDLYLDWVEEFTMTLGLENFNLMGHSFGGGLAMHYALKYPQKVKKLILSAPLVTKSSRTAFGLGNRATMSYLFSFVKSPKKFASPIGLLFRNLASMRVKFEHLYLVKNFPEIKFEEISQAVIVIWAGKDIVLDPAEQQQKLSRIKKVKILSFPEGDHDELLLRAEEIATKISE